MSSLYTFASFGRCESLGFRLGGPGLGNLLFPWARSVVFAKQYGLRRINTTWRTLKLGPILRGEFDKRFYSDLFFEHEMGGIKKWWLLNFSKHHTENEAKQALKQGKNISGVVIFKGMEDLFDPICTQYDFVKKELMKMISPGQKEAFEKFEGKGIGVHVRMGDFQPPPDEAYLRQGHWNYRLPLEWYIDTIEKIRKEAGKNVDVCLFSDGTDEELKPLLSLPNVNRTYLGSAIADMIGLSKTSIMIASASTFSMWASYLGRMPIVWYPSLQRQKLYDNESIFEGELDYETPVPKTLKKNINDAFS